MFVVVMTTSKSPTRLQDHIKDFLPWAHGHKLKSIATFVAAIHEKQTGIQAELARTQGNQEAAVRRLSRLIHNQRLNPKDFPEWLCRQALAQLPRKGKVRIAIDWTTEDDQHLTAVSLVIGHRAMPIYWRAYEQANLKGWMRRYELAVVKRAYKLILQFVKPSRIRLTAVRQERRAPVFELQSSFAARARRSTAGRAKAQRQARTMPQTREKAGAMS